MRADGTDDPEAHSAKGTLVSVVARMVNSLAHVSDGVLYSSEPFARDRALLDIGWADGAVVDSSVGQLVWKTLLKLDSLLHTVCVSVKSQLSTAYHFWRGEVPVTHRCPLPSPIRLQCVCGTAGERTQSTGSGVAGDCVRQLDEDPSSCTPPCGLSCGLEIAETVSCGRIVRELTSSQV